MQKTKLISYLAAASAVSCLPAQAEILHAAGKKSQIAKDLDTNYEGVSSLEHITVNIDPRFPQTFGNTSIALGPGNGPQIFEISLRPEDLHFLDTDNGAPVGEGKNGGSPGGKVEDPLPPVAEAKQFASRAMGGKNVTLTDIQRGKEVGPDISEWSSVQRFMFTEGGYLGFRAIDSGIPYYGWLKYSTHSASGIQIEEVAIQTEPGESINAGQTRDENAPPNSLLLFAEGLSGLRAYRDTPATQADD